MLSLDGDTAPYLQYAYARIRSIFRRTGTDGPPDAPVHLVAAAERALAFELVGFAAVVNAVEQSLAFHQLAGYLHRLATTFSGFYEQCPVLRADAAVRDSRLVLCDLTARVLRQGLHLLGIRTPERM